MLSGRKLAVAGAESPGPSAFLGSGRVIDLASLVRRAAAPLQNASRTAGKTHPWKTRDSVFLSAEL